MIRLLQPRLSISSVFDLDLDDLKDDGYQGLIMDLDNTLVGWNRPEVPKSLTLWLREVRQHGIEMCIVSNNLSQRVEEFSEKIGVSFIAKAAKPRSWRAQRAALLVLPTARTAEGRRLREFRQGLIDHLGGQPNTVQLTLVDRATVLMHHLNHLDRRAEIEGGLSEHSTRVFLAWQNTLTRTLQAIGLHPAPPSPGAAVDRIRALISP